ncbi:MAG: transposase [Microgenomates group bacterium]
MALRKTILATGEFYHVFNRSVRGLPIFKRHYDYQLFLEAAQFYLQPNPPVKFSFYRIQKKKYPLDLSQPLVTVIAYCLLPTHFHFILRQEKDKGIRQFMQKLLNSYAHYFTLKYQSRGPVFEGNFKAVRVENEEQLLHLSRYIHLNPVSSYLVENPKDYPYSSYEIYLGEKQGLADPSTIMDNIKTENYKEFVLDRKDYQRQLEQIKHLVLE